MKWLLFIFIGVIAYLIYSSEANASDSGSNSQAPGSVDIPEPFAPVVTDTACTSKTDAQGNWYGIDFSGNCSIGALGGEEGEW